MMSRTGIVMMIGLFGAAMAAAAVPSAAAAETRGYVVSWFYPSIAVQSEQADCPHGMNAKDAATNVVQSLTAAGLSQSDIKKAMAGFPASAFDVLATRARIKGKPADPYLNPTVMPDLHLKTGDGNLALGFNLDGNEATGGFTDPETGEQGVDNQLFRVYGCSGALRANPGTRPSWTSDVWQLAQPLMPAWLIEISGIQDLQNSPDVVLRISNAASSVVMDAKGRVQSDMTFQEDDNPLTKTTIHGAIKNGVLITDVMPSLTLLGRNIWLHERRWTKARIRLKFQPDGSVTGIIAGYHKWAPIYAETMGGGDEADAVTIDIPSLYYAFRRLADADPDPKLGFNTSISTAFSVEAVPAFIRPQPASSQPPVGNTAPTETASLNGDPATPLGITIKQVEIGQGVVVNDSASNKARERTVFANDKGFVLYTSDGDPAGESRCADECAKTWIPALADPAAKTVGYWSIINRPDGSQQWAFRGRALYVYASDTVAPKSLQTREERIAAAASALAECKDRDEENNNGQSRIADTRDDAAFAALGGFLKCDVKGQGLDGHHVVEIRPEQWMKLPADFQVLEVRSAPGYWIKSDI